MPLYEFYCSDCRKKSEELCGSSVSQISCPTCRGDAKKIFSTFRTGGSAADGGASSGCGG